MAKTLYISDLDGTLLNRNAELSPFAVEGLRALCSKGIYLSVATARTAATVAAMLAPVGVNTPVVLMNGVCTYDLSKEEYVSVEYISSFAKSQAMQIIADHGLSGFWYCIEDGKLSTYYENTDSPDAKLFIEERQRKYNKPFFKVDSFSSLSERGLVYYSISDVTAKLEPAASQLKEVQGLRVEYYRDVYNPRHSYLELCSSNASKKNAVSNIRKTYGFEKAVGFGDNYNDIPLLEACDEFYAVSNAVEELKKRSTAVIGANTGDAVVRWLLENAE
ncbi:MAG: HAD-IIB family hydrolase [Clostridia bacterium]|nr:HAD-IIB family hydrolase [Clostridia bacterium]